MMPQAGASPREADAKRRDQARPTGAALRTEGLVKRFGGLLATDHVDLALEPGELHALIGPNGAGKTTLVGQLSGELRPDEGRVWLGERDVTRLPVDARARLGLARSYQITQFCPDFTTLENVAMASLQGELRAGGHAAGAGALARFFDPWSPLRRQTAALERARSVVARVGLGSLVDVPAGDLGHGEHRQLELAMALALEPSVLLLDEPLAGMSSAESDTMVALLQSLRGRYPILLIEHDMNAVFALADRISVLVYGRVIASGTPQAIREHPEVRSAYLGDEDMIA
ncbi:MAG: ABC transporter ATP-binding protein [Lautropia sp.]